MENPEIDARSPETAALRVFAYDFILKSGTPPTSADIAAHFGVTADASLRAIRQANAGKTLLPHPQTGEIWMAGPFAAAPTEYQVTDGQVRWWANCAWDMLGVAAIVGRKVRAETRCTDCGQPFALDIHPALPFAGDGVVHFLVPARRWYDDIGFT